MLLSCLSVIILIGADGKQSLVREKVLKSELLRGVIKRPLKVPKWASEGLYTYHDAEFGLETPEGYEYYISDSQKLRIPLRRFKDYVVLLNLEIPKRAIADSPKKEYRWQGKQDRFAFYFLKKVMKFGCPGCSMPSGSWSSCRRSWSSCRRSWSSCRST